MLERACTLVREWLENADTERRMMALEALQVAVTATREAATLSGVLPVDPLPFITQEQSSRCTWQDNKGNYPLDGCTAA
jgi:hypothetical protein